MRNTYLTCLLALLLLPISSAFSQSHLGLGVELLAPITPYSKGYGLGYGASFMYRRFEMTRPLILDVSVGFTRTSAKKDANFAYGSGFNSYIYKPYTLRSYYAKFGLGWAFLPNASPYTQPYAGFELGYSLNSEGSNITHNQYLAGLRLGWMTYLAERVLFGLEMKYNAMISLDGRSDKEYTSIGEIMDHQMSFQFTTNVRLGR